MSVSLFLHALSHSLVFKWPRLSSCVQWICTSVGELRDCLCTHICLYKCLLTEWVPTCTYLFHLTILYSFHVLWKSTLPSSLRWMTVHPPPTVSMLQYTYIIGNREKRRVGKKAIGLSFSQGFRRCDLPRTMNSPFNMILSGIKKQWRVTEKLFGSRHSFSQLLWWIIFGNVMYLCPPQT